MLSPPKPAATRTPADTGEDDGPAPTSGVVCNVPNDENVAQLLTDLLGREVTAVWEPGNHPLPERGRIATYSTDHDQAVAVAVADAAFANRTGAALVLIPPGKADEATEEGDVPEMLGENFHEVVNIMASLLNAEESAHVRLTSVIPVDGPVPEDVKHVLERQVKRRVFYVNIDGYGRGSISFMLV